MTTMIKNASRFLLSAEENNEMVEQGYKYMVEGDWETLNSTDPWSGMPNTTSNLHFFTDYEEAKEYADAQTWVFCHDIHGTVEELKRKETRAEREEREAREAEERKARKIARDLAKGITPEKRKALNSLKRHEGEARRIEAEIEALKAELEAERKIIERKKAEVERM